MSGSRREVVAGASDGHAGQASGSGPDGAGDPAVTGAGPKAHEAACLCGGVQLRISGPLASIQVCHCGQCRRAQGGPFATNIPVDLKQVEFVSGESLLQAYESSPGKERVFCRVCGSPVFSRRHSLAGVIRLRAGLLKEPVGTSPAFHFHVEDKAGWWPILDDLPRFAAGGVPETVRPA